MLHTSFAELSVPPAASRKSTVIARIKRSNMELQFWGYELGNVLATIAGAGGFLSFYQTIETVVSSQDSSTYAAIGQLLTLYSDASVALGLGVLVLVVPAIRTRVVSRWHPRWLNALDLTTTILALVILCYSIVLQASWIAIASSCFVVGSCLLRQSRDNPILLKAGGLVLALGGIGLALFGFQFVISSTTIDDKSLVIMGALTLATGLYVVFAGLLTYEGGIFATRDFVSKETDRANAVWFSQLAHPVNGALARFVFVYSDRSIVTLNKHISKPSIFWASKYTRDNRPFKTSMLARLPWRVMTGLAALLTMTPAGFAFFTANVFWAIGDLAIGSEDW